MIYSQRAEPVKTAELSKSCGLVLVFGWQSWGSQLAREAGDRAARSNSERAAPSACVDRRLSAPSQGTIFRTSRRLDSIVEMKRRIRGPTCDSKETAEEHGLKLCKDWIDKLL